MNLQAILLTSGVILMCLQDAPPPAEPRSIAETDGRIVHFVVDSKQTTVFTLSEKNTVACWSLTKKVEVWRGKGEDALNIALSIGTKNLYIGNSMPLVTTRDVADGKLRPGVLAAIPPPNPLAYAADPNDRWIWVGLDNGGLSRIVPSDPKTASRRTLGNGGAASLAIDPEGNLLAVGGMDKTIRFVGASSANVDDKKVFEGLSDAVTALAFAPSEKLLLSGAKDGGLRLWTVATGKVRFELAGHTVAIRALACDAKGARAASGDESGKILVWDLSKGNSVATFQAMGAVSALAFLDKGKTLAASDNGSAITLFEIPK